MSKFGRKATAALCASIMVAVLGVPTVGAETPVDWQTLSGPGNPISIKYPKGWSATTDAPSGRIDIKSDSGASLSVLPFFIANQTVEGLGPEQFFNTFIKAFAPNETWSEPQTIGTSSFRSTYANDSESAAAALVIYQSPKGVSGQVCIAKTPKGAEISADTFAQMLGSLKYNTGVTAASQFDAAKGGKQVSGFSGASGGTAGGGGTGSFEIAASGGADPWGVNSGEGEGASNAAGAASDDDDDEGAGSAGQTSGQSQGTTGQGAVQFEGGGADAARQGGGGSAAGAPQGGDVPSYMPGVPMGAGQVPSREFQNNAPDPMLAAQDMSFQQQGNGSGLPATAFSGWTRFNDPSEGCFWVDVPAGWKIDGGLTRGSAIDTRPWVKAISPDDLITAFVGDGRVPPFTMPTGTLSALGFRAGRNYNGSVVANYMPARKFVEWYARTNMKKFFTDIQVVEENDHPDVAAAMNGTVGASRSEAASIKLTAMYGNIPVVAYYLASTKATVGYGTGMWWVTLIAGEVSPADRDKAGLSVILRMISSFTINPVWKGESLKTTAAVSQNYRAASQQISKSISDRYWSQQAFNDRMNQSYWNQQASQDRTANNFSNYIRGQETVADPATGTQYQVQSGPQYHYIDPTGNYYAGSDSTPPSPDWRQLMAVP